MMYRLPVFVGEAMKIISKFAAPAALALLATSAAHAWRVEKRDDRNLWVRCDDNSQARVTWSGSYWTVVSAGKDGKTGGEFRTDSSAAYAGCGEEP